MSSKKMIRLKSSDNLDFDVEEEAVVQQSQFIKNMIQDGYANSVIPVLNVTGKILAKVIEYCRNHAAIVVEPSSSVHPEVDIDALDAQLIDVDEATLFEIILAANYLHIKKLMDLAAQAIAEKMKDKTVEEVRQMFSVENDFSPEEELKIRNENPWAYDV